MRRCGSLFVQPFLDDLHISPAERTLRARRRATQASKAMRYSFDGRKLQALITGMIALFQAAAVVIDRTRSILTTATLFFWRAALGLVFDIYIIILEFFLVYLPYEFKTPLLFLVSSINYFAIFIYIVNMRLNDEAVDRM